MNRSIKTISSLILAISAVALSHQANASGFALIEQGASGQGAAYAGAAAIGEDASTIFFNPAAMTKLSGRQIVVAGHVVTVGFDYKDSLNSSDASGVPGSLQGINSDGGETAFVPNFYWTSALDNGLHVGVGVNVPFGLATEYDDGWYGRYHGLKSEITTININPAIAWKVTDAVSLGFGLNYQYIDVELTQNIDSSATCFNLSGSPCGAFSDPAIDSSLKLEGDDSSFGWNIGVLIDVSRKDRVGIAYRSEIKQDIEGNATYNLYAPLQAIIDSANQNPPLAPNFSILSNTALIAAAQLPETFSLSYVRDINTSWTFLADYTWTGWSNIDSINVVLAGNAPGRDPALELAFKNTNRIAVGAHYKPGNNWIFRGGLAYDETPVRSDSQRTVRIPDNDRTWLSLGFGYAPSTSWSFDVGYSHLFVSDTGINSNLPTSSGATLIGTYDAAVDIVSAGVNFNF